MAGLRVLLLCVWVAVARAPVAQPDTVDPGLDPNPPYSVRRDVCLLPNMGGGADTTSSVSTADYRLRMLDQGIQQQTRYGVCATDQASWRLHPPDQATVTSRPQLNFVQESPFLGRKVLAGLQYERKDVLFEGDQLSIRSISDVQTLARGVGLLGTDAEGAVLSLLGWRSHSVVVWQLGDPARELQWRFSAGMDRRATAQNGSVALQLLRRF